MDGKGEGKDTSQLAVATRGQTSKAPAGIMGTRKPQDLGDGRKPLTLPLFTLFEAPEGILTLATFHEADHNSNFQTILVKEKETKPQLLHPTCQDPAFEGRGSDWGTSESFHVTVSQLPELLYHLGQEEFQGMIEPAAGQLMQRQGAETAPIFSLPSHPRTS